MHSVHYTYLFIIEQERERELEIRHLGFTFKFIAGLDPCN